MKRDLEPLTTEVIQNNRLPNEIKMGRLYQPLKVLIGIWRRLAGRFSVEDGLKIACYCEPPLYFLLRGVVIGHPYGITISAEEIGADCSIAQNVTIGTAGTEESTPGGLRSRPSIGNLVIIYRGAVISGVVRLGSRVIIGANAFVDKDVPDDPIVYGNNRVQPLKDHHRALLKNQLARSQSTYKLVPGFVYVKGGLFIDRGYLRTREAILGTHT